jgi:hypothetical protein
VEEETGVCADIGRGLRRAMFRIYYLKPLVVQMWIRGVEVTCCYLKHMIE